MVAYDGTARRYVGIQVKSLSKRNAVPLGASIQTIMGDYWIVVVGVANAKSNPLVYVIPSPEIPSLDHRTEKDGKIAYWIEPSDFDQPQYLEAWPRVGVLDNAALTPQSR